MPDPSELVASAISYFFDTALPQATGKQFADLPSPSVHVGAYTAWDGTVVATTAGQPVTPAYALRVSPALPVAAGKPNPAGVAAPTTGPARHLLYVRNVADAAVDDAAEIQRVMADLDSFVALFGDAGAGGTGAGAPQTDAPQTDASVAAARAAEWATAIVAARASLAVNLSTLTAVPPALEAVAPDLPALKEVLQHFFTYTADGTYYPRWAGAGRDVANAAHLTPQYKQHNVLEQQLERDQVYLYAVLPESLLAGGGDLGSGVFREVVIRFQPTGVPAAPFTLAAVHTVRMRPASAPFCDFVFFYAAAGVGIPLPRATLDTMSSRLVNLVGRLTSAEPLDSVLATSPTVAEVTTQQDGGSSLIHLIATVEGEPTWPPGVVVGSTDPVRIVLSPPEQVAAVAALPEVKHLGLLAPADVRNDLARGMVNLPAMDAKLAAGAKGGNGVLIGIIDSGIDASHPAFAGRIHAVWDQGTPTAAAGTSPKANHPGNAAYAPFHWGAELIGPSVGTAGDPNTARPADGHGTHVSGTAAGAEVTDGAGNVLVPAGLAPKAKIVVVRGIQVGTGNPVLGAQWIFQKATELGLPCVINMSFGHHFGAHDGSEDMDRALFGLVRQGAAYKPGRILVAAAGNERKQNIHLRRSLAANNGSQAAIATVEVPAAVSQEVSIWVRDPTGTKPTVFPLRVYLFRRTQRRNTYKDVTKAVTLGSQASTTSLPAATTPAGIFANHRTIVEVTSDLSNAINGDHNFNLTFRTTDATGNLPMIANQWGIVLVNDSASALDVHLWIPNGRATFSDATRDDDHAYLMGVPATSAGTVSVGSAVSRMNWASNAGAMQSTDQTRLGELSSFSSPGPIRASSIPPTQFNGVTHEVNGVDVTAPGGKLQSALSSQVATPQWLIDNAGSVVNNRSQVMSGTSMASPVITGIIANLLAAKPNLTLPDVLAALKAASTIPPTSDFAMPAGSGPKPLSPDWGYGLIDAGQLNP